MPGDDIDLIHLDLAVQRHRRDFGNQAGAQPPGHDLHVGHAEVQFPGDLPVGQVEAHEVQAEDPGPQGPMVAGENGAGQVVEAGFTVLASIALPVRLGISPSMTGHGSTAAGRALNAVWPAMLPNEVKTLSIVDQR
jgi:hypothetical protein